MNGKDVPKGLEVIIHAFLSTHSTDVNDQPQVPVPLLHCMRLGGGGVM